MIREPVGAIHESPENERISAHKKQPVGTDLLAAPKTNAYRKINNQPVILSAVELFSSEERGKSAKRYSGLRDLVTTLGGFFDGM